MRFDFACFAICEMTIEDDLDLDLHEVDATLLSFHLTVLDAMKEQTHRTELLRAAHKARYRDPGWPWSTPELKEPIYRVVPIQDMTFHWLSDAQEMIEAAAVLRQKGCGV